MGMSTHVEGFKARDEKWEKMEAVWKSCTEAGLSIPDEVNEFFEWEPPDGRSGQKADLDDSVTEWDDGDMCAGYEIEVAKIPSDVTHIRVYNSW